MSLFGRKSAILTLLILIGTQVAFLATSLWLSRWVGSHKQNTHADTTIYAAIYGVLVAMSITLSSISVVAFQCGAWKAANTMHDRMAGSVIMAPATWFDRTPAGQIINRFSNDTRYMDSDLPDSLRAFLENTFRLLLRLYPIALIMPIFVLPAAIFCATGLLLGEMYTRTQVSVRNLASAARSPVISHCKETLENVIAIRAQRLQGAFTDILADRLRTLARAEETQFALNRWIAIRVHIAAALVSLVVGILAIHKSHSVSAGLIGFSLTSVIGLSNTIMNLIRKGNELEVKLNCFSRVQEYADLEPEENIYSKPAEAPTIYNHLPGPTTPAIEFRNVTAKYDPNGAPILKDVSFSVKAGERIAIVGRTGCGKSSLGLSLLGFLKITSGIVLMNGVDINDMQLSQLRRGITYVPQDTFLFRGTVRDNLDPTGNVEDEVITRSWDSVKIFPDISNRIHSAKLAQPEHVRSPVTLDTKLSTLTPAQGHICGLVRAFVRQPQIVILDEPTAKISPRVEEELLDIIHSRLKGATILTITHHPKTIMDYDKVIVLSDGEIKEMGNPRLLVRREGVFRDMVKQEGYLENHVLEKSGSEEEDGQQDKEGVAKSLPLGVPGEKKKSKRRAM